jgi:methyltransferase-like protein 6
MMLLLLLLSGGRVEAFVADITADQLSQQLPGACVDYCSMVFVLSAVTPDKMPQV